MTLVLACTWNPLDAELPQLQRLLPQLEAVYSHLVIAVRPGKLATVQILNEQPLITIFEMAQRGGGRYQALQKALEFEPDYVTYADLDAILHWIDERPEEWRQSLPLFSQSDCLVIGRSQKAFETRPQAIQQTERIINEVFSNILGQRFDFGLGLRSFSRAAVELIGRESQPGRWGDAEWPLLVNLAGLTVRFLAIDGADWEPSSRGYIGHLDPEERRRLAERYDQEPTNWQFRVRIAHDIIQQGLEVWRAPAALAG